MFSTRAKSLSSFWRRCPGLLNHFNLVVSLLFRIFVIYIFVYIYKITLVSFILSCAVLWWYLFCCFCEVKQNTIWFRMGDVPSRRTLGDYGIGTHQCLITHGFQPANPVAFNIKNSILVGLRETQYDGGSLQDSYEHLSIFYESCLFCCPDGVT